MGVVDKVGTVLCTIWTLTMVMTAFVTGFFLVVTHYYTTGWLMSDSKRSNISGLLFRTCCQLFVIRLNPFWWATVVNKRTTPLPKGAILMSNHLSFADSFLVSKVLMPTYEAKFVAMKMVFDLPFGGWAIRFCEDLKIVFELCEDGVTWRTKKGTTKAMFKLAQKHADNGTSIMVYPEGELSRDGEMIDFKDGFFKFALKNNMPIVPLAMWGNKNVWPTDTFHMNPGKLNIAVGENIEINDFDTVDTVREKTFAAIVALRNDLPLFKERGEMDIQRFKNHIANEERRLEEIEEAKAAKREVAVRVSPADGNGDIEAPSPNLGSGAPGMGESGSSTSSSKREVFEVAAMDGSSRAVALSL